MTCDWVWLLEASQCVGCGVCADVCSSTAIRMTREMPWPEPVIGSCTGCLDCVEQCPTAAITVELGADDTGAIAAPGRIVV